MADFQEPMLENDGVSDYHQPLRKLTRLRWWILIILNVFFLIVGQAVALLLGRYYYDNGGSSEWMASLVQTAACPILVIPYFFLRPSDDAPTLSSSPSVLTQGIVYFIVGTLFAINGMMISYALWFLSVSTYSLVSSTQLAFTAVFSYFINRQKFSALILNCVVVLTLSAALLAVNNDDTDKPLGVSNKMYIIGILIAVGASALYSFSLSLMQLIFESVIKKETLTVVLELQIFTSFVATSIFIAGLFITGEWRSIAGEMHSFSGGKVAYVVTLVLTAVAWQLYWLAVISFIFLVSSLFSNVMGMLSMVVTPISAVIIYHDKMNGVKMIAMMMAFWGFISYIYQKYCDERGKAMRNDRNSNDSVGI